MPLLSCEPKKEADALLKKQLLSSGYYKNQITSRLGHLSVFVKESRNVSRAVN